MAKIAWYQEKVQIHAALSLTFHVLKAGKDFSLGIHVFVETGCWVKLGDYSY